MPDKENQTSTTKRKARQGTASPANGKPLVDRLAVEIGKRIADARSGLGWSQLALHTRTKLTDPEGMD